MLRRRTLPTVLAATALVGLAASPAAPALPSPFGNAPFPGLTTDTPAAAPADAPTLEHTAAGLTSTYHLFTEQVTGPPRGLVVYLDGDGQRGVNPGLDSYALGRSGGIVAQAGQRGYAVLAPVAPGGQSWWTQDPQAKADWVASLIGQVRSETGLGTAPVWLVGFSGGSQLITKHLLPAHGTDFAAGGGAVVSGGGGAPNAAPRVPDGFKMHFTTGQDDTGPGYDALSDARRGSAAYHDAGAAVTLDTPAGQDHSDTPQTLGQVLASQLDASPTATPAPQEPTPQDPTPGEPAPGAPRSDSGLVPIQTPTDPTPSSTPKEPSSTPASPLPAPSAPRPPSSTPWPSAPHAPAPTQPAPVPPPAPTPAQPEPPQPAAPAPAQPAPAPTGPARQENHEPSTPAPSSDDLVPITITITIR